MSEPAVSQTRPIILSRPDRVGDAIIASACFAAVKAAHPDAPLYFLARGVMRPLFEGHPLLAGFLEAVDLEKRWAEAHEKGLRLRLDLVAETAEIIEGVDAGVIVHLQPDEYVEAAAAKVGIPVRVGYATKAEHQLTIALPDTRRMGGCHERDFNHEMLIVGSLNVGPDFDAVPSLHPSPAAKERMQDRIPAGRFAVVNPGAHSDTLRWPAERFAELSARLQDELGLEIVLIGAKAEDPSVRVIADRLPRARCLAGQTDLAELAWLLAAAAVHVSRDTGTAHLASAMGCPVVTLFGRTQPEYGPERWRPLGPGRVELVVTDIGSKRWLGLEPTRSYWRRGFERISVERVFAAVRAVISDRAQ